jgi:predicted NAD/FAD-binding protein
VRIAIVGAGVSGLVAAHLLAREHEIVVYEASAYAGGHAHTVRVEGSERAYDVDTGFVVMNDRNYPNFTRLLHQLDVPTQPTHMSFSVKSEDDDFEYAGTPRGLYCQRRNLVRPRFQHMVLDLLRFNRELRAMLAPEHTASLARACEDSCSQESLGEFLVRRRFSRTFVERLIVPQVSAVWSADPRHMRSFPVRFIAEFFANHGMLGFRDRPRWSTITGGSARYVDALIAPFREHLRLHTPVRAITRHADHVELNVGDARASDESARFDQVVIATHSDQALALLSDASSRERTLLGAIPYQRNEAVLHTDSTLLPRRHGARAAWNFHLLREPKPLSTVTYYMNHLQRLRSERHYCVTLNRTESIDPEQVIRTISYSHPVYTPAGVAAQAEHASISGLARRTHYCGAYWGWGFHEDGVLSALRACAPFGAKL